jgi:hypothetical protein
MLPFLLVAASTAVLVLRRRSATRVLLLLLLGWSVLVAVRQQPAFLAYFNELAGGTDQGHRYLGDSNLDWGQELKALANEVREHGGPWTISYAGTADPAYYGIAPDLLVDPQRGALAFPAANPLPGRYAISANHWQGLLDDPDTFDWFRRQEPEKTLGGSILIYEVAAQADGAWVAHCTQPWPLLAAAEAEAILGKDGLRHVWFDCTQSLVLPAGETPGWFIVPQADEWWPLQLLPSDAASRMRLVYRHRATGLLPSFDVYYWPGGPLAPDAARALPAAFAADDLARLEGYLVDGDAWTTFWQVESATERPLSMRAHLYLEGQAAPLVGDSLGYTSEQWAPGDTLWQRFPFPASSGARYLETGLYDYQTLEPVGDVVQLPAPR